MEVSKLRMVRDLDRAMASAAPQPGSLGVGDGSVAATSGDGGVADTGAGSVFISYEAHDLAVANEIRQHVEAGGFSCWMAPEDVRGPLPWPEQIERAIDGCDVMLVVVSSQAGDSPHVSREVDLAVEKSKPLVPVRIADVVPTGSLSYLLRLAQWIDLFPGSVADHATSLQCTVSSMLAGTASRTAVTELTAVAGQTTVPAPGGSGHVSGPEPAASPAPRTNTTRAVFLAIAVAALVAAGLVIGVVLSAGGGDDTADSPSAGRSGEPVEDGIADDSPTHDAAAEPDGELTGESADPPAPATDAATTPTGPTSTDASADSNLAVRQLGADEFTVTATSTLGSMPGCGGTCYFLPDQVSDGSTATAWSEGVDGLGFGEALEFDFGVERHVTRVDVVPGWQRGEACLFERNGRPKELLLRFDSGPSYEVDLPAEASLVKVPVDVSASSFDLVILDVWPGSECEGEAADPDTLITEVAIMVAA